MSPLNKNLSSLLSYLHSTLPRVICGLDNLVLKPQKSLQCGALKIRFTTVPLTSCTCSTFVWGLVMSQRRWKATVTVTFHFPRLAEEIAKPKRGKVRQQRRRKNLSRKMPGKFLRLCGWTSVSGLRWSSRINIYDLPRLSGGDHFHFISTHLCWP